MPTRLGYLVSHPIQYQVPLLRELATMPGIELKVYFCSDFSAKAFRDPGFNREIKWNVSLLDGYDYEVLPAFGSSQPRSCLGPFNYGLKRRLKKDQIDVLWLHGYTTLFFIHAIRVAKKIGIKVMLRGESMGFNEVYSPIKNRLKPFFYRWLAHQADVFLTIGTLNRRFLLSNHISENKLVLAPYTIDNHFFRQYAAAGKSKIQQVRESLSLDPERPIILYASKFIERKCANDLIKAYLAISQKHQFSRDQLPYLLLIGDGKLKHQLMSLAKRTSEENIKFLGFINQVELPLYFQLCDVFVLPSERENWGLVVNEVMNAGKPVIVSDQVGCAPDLIDDYKNGRIFKTHDISALAACLEWAITLSPAERSSLAHYTLNKISRWGIQETAQGVLAGCQLVMSGCSSKP